MPGKASSQPGNSWLWLLAGAALLSQTALNLVRPVVTYKLLELEADAMIVGLVTAAYAVLPLAAAMWLGRMTDRTRRLGAMMAAGAVMLAAGASGLALAPNVPLVAAASAVLGMGHLVFTIAGQSSVARFAPEGKLDQGFGWFTAAYSAGQLFGPLLAGFLLSAGSIGMGAGRSGAIDFALWAGAVLSLLVVPVTLVRRRASRAARGARPGEVTAGTGGQESPARATMMAILRIPGVPSHMAASLALLAMLDILIAFLPLIGERAGISPAWVGFLLAVRGAASIISRAFLPVLSNRFSRRRLLLVSLYGAGLALALPPLVVGEVWLAALLLFVGGFCLGLGQPLTMTLVSTAVPPLWRGTGLTVRLMGNRAGQVVMPLLAALVAAPLGPTGAIWFSCAVLIASGTEKSLRR
ncbi:MFS transporter [Arthrobacter sp. Z4-13]